MKQIKILAALAIALSIAIPAAAATVTWTGGANARLGYQQLNADYSDVWSSVLMSKLSQNDKAFGVALTAGGTAMGNKLGADFLTYSGTGVQSALLQTAIAKGLDISVVSTAGLAAAADLTAQITQAATTAGAAFTSAYTARLLLGETGVTALTNANTALATQNNQDGLAFGTAFRAAKILGDSDAVATAKAGAAVSPLLVARATSVGTAAGTAALMAELKRFATPSTIFAMGYAPTGEYQKKSNFIGLKNESAVEMGANIVSDSKKLTGKVDVKFRAYDATVASTAPIDLQTAWVMYDFGPLAIKYNTADLSNRWDSYILYVGDYTGHNSLDFQIKPVADAGYAFVTIMSDQGLNGVKYENVELRKISMFSAGYAYESDAFKATLGGVYDDKKKTDRTAEYTGYMAFGSVNYKSGKIGSEVGTWATGLSGVYGKNTSRFAGMDPVDMEQATLGLSNIDAYLAAAGDPSIDDIAAEFNTVSNVAKAGVKDDSYVKGAHFYAAYTAWMGGILSIDARYSQCTLQDSDPYTAQRYTAACTQAFDENFMATLGAGYEKYSVQPGDKLADAAWGYEVMVELGYKF